MRNDRDPSAQEFQELQPEATFSETPDWEEEVHDTTTSYTAPIVPIETFYLVGIRLNGRSDTPDLFTFLFEQGGETRPLLHAGQIVLFTQIELAETALRTAGIVARFRSLSLENVYLIDVAHVLFLLATESADPQKKIANVLDLFARILTGLGIGVPPVYADILIDLGNQVNGNEFYGDFMAVEEFRRERAIDAVRWCLGTILSVANIIKVTGG